MAFIGSFRAVGGKVDYVAFCFDDQIVFVPAQLANTIASLVAQHVLKAGAEPLEKLADQDVPGVGSIFSKLLDAAAEPVADRLRHLRGGDRFESTEHSLEQLVLATTPEQIRDRFSLASAISVSDITGVGFDRRRRKTYLKIRTVSFRWYGLLRTAELEIPESDIPKALRLLQETIPDKVHNVRAVRGY